MIEVRLAPPTTTELLIVNSARVSLSQSSTILSDRDRNLIRFLYQQSHWTPFGHPQLSLIFTPDTPTSGPKVIHTVGSTALHTNGLCIERGSLWYWLNNYRKYGTNADAIAQIIAKHAPSLAVAANLPPYTPSTESSTVVEFAVTDAWVADRIRDRAPLATATLLIRAPVPIRTQCFKHKYGFCENEVSRRYVDAPPTFFTPKTWRSRAPSVKQGSLETPVRYHWLAKTIAKAAYGLSSAAYRTQLALGVCPEQARFLLAQGMETEWYWTASLTDFRRAFLLRHTPHAQREIWELFDMLDQRLKTLWPKTWALMSSTTSAE